ncbi:MAG: ABC transporter permease subunit [Oscillospiraceae bacterium]|nr:ABC transporter permease subunit [Oscillospiraceae bacterium]
MGAIMRREINSYFTSAVGYIFMAVFFLLSGLYFSNYFSAGVADMSYLFSAMFTITMFMIPVLTMRLMSEDKKNKTDQALLTAPVSLGGVVFGKFFAACLMFLITISITLVEGIAVAVVAELNWSLIFSNFSGLYLAGCAMISIGMFISSLTENQVIAAVGAFAAALAMSFLDSIIPNINNAFLKKVAVGASFTSRYKEFYRGILDVSNLIFFISIMAIFVFLTIRTLEKKRWS